MLRGILVNKRKFIAITSVIGLIGFTLIFVGNGCSGQFQIDPANRSSSSSSSAASASTPVDFVPGTKAVSVVYAQQALDQLSACAGVAIPSDATQKMYESKKGQISVYGTAETITSPMMMALVSISGEICNDLINQERNLAVKRIFKGWDLNSAMLPASGFVNESITRMSLSCWQRPENSVERQSVLDAAFAVKDGEVKASEKMALMICTSMLSSLNSLLN